RGALRVRPLRHVRGAEVFAPAAHLRTDDSRRPHRLRSERRLAPGVDDAAEELRSDRRREMGRVESCKVNLSALSYELPAASLGSRTENTSWELEARSCECKAGF